MLSVIKSIVLHGLEGFLINVEVDVSGGMPCWDIVGLPDTNIREAKERVKTAIKNCGIELLSRKYIINLSPATIKKTGTLLDLPIAIGILKSIGIIKNQDFNNMILIGELSLSGKLNKINGVLPMCIEAKKQKIEKIILPKINAKEARIINGIKIVGVENLNECIDYLNGKINIKEEQEVVTNVVKNEDILDYIDVKGQQTIKRALEIATSGSHNCLLIGSPGCGKTMMAQRIPSIMPDLSFDEALEISKIYSVAGILKNDFLMKKRPFRSPHHTITNTALIGGGKIPKPGEISLAHMGVLFLDEFLEFNKSTLELLRIPIENKTINISRVGMNVTYPANFMLVASTNPCPCGYYGSKLKKCICTEKQIKKYRAKLSGPIIDRFDMHIKVSSIKYKELNDTDIENSKAIRERVNIARKIQYERYKKYSIYSNSEMTPNLIEKYCILKNKAKQILDKYFLKMKMTTRAYFKVLKVARTIADLEQSESVELEHVIEAIQYRSLDENED